MKQHYHTQLYSTKIRTKRYIERKRRKNKIGITNIKCFIRAKAIVNSKLCLYLWFVEWRSFHFHFYIRSHKHTTYIYDLEIPTILTRFIWCFGSQIIFEWHQFSSFNNFIFINCFQWKHREKLVFIDNFSTEEESPNMVFIILPAIRIIH